jgi:CRISPR-associated protein Cas5/CasD subtype I-E
MQSYADTGFGQLREAGPFPSRAAVLGIVAAAEGIGRGDPELVTLHKLFRVDIATVRSGRIARDYHSVEARLRRDDVERFETWERPQRGNKTLTWRAYHHDAHFVALVKSDDETAVSRAVSALRSPVYTAFLGRRSCPPSTPLLPAEVTGNPYKEMLAAVSKTRRVMPKTGERRWGRRPTRIHVYLDGRYATCPEEFGLVNPTYGTRRDLLVTPVRAFVSRPYTHVVLPQMPKEIKDTNEQFFDATP